MKKIFLLVIVCIILSTLFACSPEPSNTDLKIPDSDVAAEEKDTAVDVVENQQEVAVSSVDIYIDDFKYYYNARFGKNLEIIPTQELDSYNIEIDGQNIGSATVLSANDCVGLGVFLEDPAGGLEVIANELLETNIATACRFDEQTTPIVLDSNISMVDQAVANSGESSHTFGEIASCSCTPVYEDDKLVEFVYSATIPEPVLEESYDAKDKSYIDSFVAFMEENWHIDSIVDNILPSEDDPGVLDPEKTDLELATEFDAYFEAFFGDKYDIVIYTDEEIKYGISIDDELAGLLQIIKEDDKYSATLSVFIDEIPQEAYAHLVESYMAVFGVDWNIENVYNNLMLNISTREVYDELIVQEYCGIKYGCCVSLEENFHIIHAERKI